MERKTKLRGSFDGGVCSDATDRLTVLEHDTRASRSHVPPVAKEWRRADGRVVATGPSSAVVALHPVRLIQSVRHELYDMFLPAGYPSSVTEDYLPFQLWDTCQVDDNAINDDCDDCYLRGVLATQSVLESVGVGNEAITPLAAALQWVMRDGSGMLGGLFFAYGVGPKFDANVKFWRLYADMINDVGLTLDMLAPFFPAYVTQVLCVSSVCKAMCGVAAGATRSSLTAHFARHDNMADIAAKEGSQETFVTLCGLLCGMYFANVVNQSRASVWVAFLVLTGVHVLANYNAVTALRIPTLNQQRAALAIQHYRHGNTHLLSVPQINAMESIFGFRRHLSGFSIHLGAPLPSKATELAQLVHLFDEEHYVVTVDFDTRCVRVSFLVSATSLDMLRGYYTAAVVLDGLNVSLKRGTGSSTLPLVTAAYNATVAEFEPFLDALESAQWKTQAFPLGAGHLRYSFRQ